jgi:molybdopterin-synthase adenylyltransferase
MVPMLNDAERERYARQIRLFGEEGQERLKRANVFIAGAGGLGSIISIYMAAAGFGRIFIADCDSVEISNLNRQVLHRTKDLGRYKADSARDMLNSINPEIAIETRVETINEKNIGKLLQGYDLIMDAMDNFPTRYLLNKAALSKEIPLFHGAISGLQGQATTIIPGKTGCMRCIFPRPPPASTFPALGSTCGVIGSIQVTEAVKYILGLEGLLQNRLLLWDGLSACLEEVAYLRNPGCVDCGEHQGGAGMGDNENK